MKIIKQLIFFLAISIILNWVCFILKSDAFAKYLRENIVVLLITLLAINTATISVLVAKLHEISRLTKHNFNLTISEVKKSLYEQIYLIGASSLFVILYNSAIIKSKFLYHEMFFNVLFTAIFIYAIDILRDTGIAIFDIIKFPANKDDSKPPSSLV